ncbi:cytochrome P450 [Xylariaceae sp. FL0016]|nr:cytochrome P450 [Xylariaceae sp. FL0016]
MNCDVPSTSLEATDMTRWKSGLTALQQSWLSLSISRAPLIALSRLSDLSCSASASPLTNKVLAMIPHMAAFWAVLVLAGLALYVYRDLGVCQGHRAGKALSGRDTTSVSESTQRTRGISKHRGQHGSIAYANRIPLGLDLLIQATRAVKAFRLMEYWLGMFCLYGHTFQHAMGWKSTIFTIEPANLEAMLSSNSKDWGIGMRRTVFLPLFGEGIFVQNGEAWKHSRDSLRPHLYPRYYHGLDIFRPHVGRLLEVLSCQTGVVDTEPLFFRLALDVSTEFLFGESVGSQRPLSSIKSNDFESALDLAQAICITCHPSLSAARLYRCSFGAVQGDGTRHLICRS